MTDSAKSADSDVERQPDTPYHPLRHIPDIEQQILERIGKGQSLKSIGDDLGVSNTAIWRRAMQHPDYQAQLSVGVELRMDKRESELEQAATNVDVTRADRLLGHARWLAERTAPARFGQSTKITGSDGGPIQVEIVRYGATIDGQVVDKSVDK